MRGNIPRTLEMFGELRLSLFRRYFRFIFTFVFLEHLFPRLFLEQETFSSIDQRHNPPHSVFVVFYFEQNSGICGFLCESEPAWEWLVRVRMRATGAGEGAAVSSSTVPAGEAALR